MIRKNFKKFIKLNKQSVNYYKNSKYVIMIDRGRFLSGVTNMMVVMALNKIFKLNPLIVTDFRNPDIFEFYKSFGIYKFKLGFKYILIFKKINIFFKSLKKLFKTIYLIKKKNFEWFINKFEIDNIKIGDLIYDTYIRNNHKYLNPKVDILFTNLLFKAIFRTFNLIEYMNLYPTSFLLIGTPGYSHNDGVALRIGLKKRIKVIEAQSHQLIRFNSKMRTYGLDNLAYNFFKKGKKLRVKLNKVNLFLKKKNRYEITSLYTGSKTFFTANKYKRKINKIQFLKKLNLNNKKFKKIILIASHAFSDASHVHGFLIFRDYYCQLKKTLEFIFNQKQLDEYLWIIRPHPSCHVFNETGIVEKLVQKFTKENLRLCPKKINTQDLTEICDTVITGRGSIGIEFACKGKYPILAGSAAYSNLGFTLDPKNKIDYFQFIKNVNNIKPLSNKQINNAKSALYILENKINQISIKRSNIVPHDRTSLSIKKRTLLKMKNAPERNLFSDQFIKNFQKTKFQNDIYYKDILKKIKYI